MIRSRSLRVLLPAVFAGMLAACATRPPAFPEPLRAPVAEPAQASDQAPERARIEEGPTLSAGTAAVAPVDATPVAPQMPGKKPVSLVVDGMPLAAFINVVFGAWHFPRPYDLMMRDHDIHIIMHLMIMATGVIMWWPVMSPLPELPRIVPPLQMVYLFVLGIPMMVVAALITFSPTAIYTWYAQAPRLFGLDLLSDQRLGGVMMWVPGALVLWIGISVVYFRWTQPEIREDEATSARAPEEGGITISPPPYREI